MRPRLLHCKSTSVSALLSKEWKKKNTEGTARIDDIIMNTQPHLQSQKDKTEEWIAEWIWYLAQSYFSG